MREGAARAIAIAFLASIALHAAIFSVLPRARELMALLPPEPVPLIARVVRPAPPPKPAPAPVQEVRKPAPPPPRRASIATTGPAPIATPEPGPAAQPPAREPRPLALEVAPAAAPAPAPAVVAPAPQPAAVSIDLGAVERFRQGLIAEAARDKPYPRVAIDNNWQGEVVVRMLVGADGRIAGLSVAQSSGHEVLDRQALEMFRNAKPRVPVPAALRGRAFELELRAVYSLSAQRSG